MKENTNIDQLFEEQLADLKVEPKVDSWDKIASSLDAMATTNVAQSNGKNRLILIALLGTIAALFAYVLFFGHSGDKDTTSGKRQQVVLPIEQKLNNEGAEKVTVTDAAQYKKPEVTDDVLNNKTFETQTKQDAKAAKPSIVESKKASTVNSSEQSRNPKEFDNSTSQINKSKVALRTEQSAKADEMAVAIEEEEKASEKEAVYITEPFTKEQNEAEISNKTQAVVVENKANVSEVSTEEKTQSIAAIDTDKKAENATTKAVAGPSPNEVSGIYASTGWSFDLFGGPAMISSNESIPMAESKMLQQTDKKSLIITPSLGLNINYHYNNWFVRSGIAYAEFGENKEYLKNTEMHDTTGYSRQLVHSYYSHDTTGWIQDPNDPSVSIPVYDAVFHSDTTYIWVSRDSLYYEHQNIYAQNRYRYIEIPLMVGYEMRFKNFGLELATGVSVGFRVNSSGLFMDSNHELVDINSSNSPYSNTMMNYMLSVGVKYHIGNRLSVIAQPVYKTNLNSLFTSSNDIRYHSIGLNLGLNYIIK